MSLDREDDVAAVLRTAPIGQTEKRYQRDLGLCLELWICVAWGLLPPLERQLSVQHVRANFPAWMDVAIP